MSSTEAPRRSSRRGGSTGGRRKQDSLPSGITPTTVQPALRDTSSSLPLTESSLTVQMAHETEVPTIASEAPTQLEAKQELHVTDLPKQEISIKEENLHDLRRKGASGRSGRNFNSSQASGNRNRNADSNAVANSVSSSTQQPSRRPSDYIDKLSKVSNSIRGTSTPSDKLPADIAKTRTGFTRRINTADSLPSASRSESHENVAEVNGSRSAGQFQTRSRVSTGTERSVGITQQRTYVRNAVRSGATGDAVPSSNSWTPARNYRSSRSRDVTTAPLKDIDGSRRSHFRGQEFDDHKVTNSMATVLESSFFSSFIIKLK